MDARAMLVSNSEELQRFVQTGQYKHSRELMTLRYQLSLTEEEMANKLGVTFEEYIGLECGNEEVSIQDYKEILQKVKGITK